MPYSFPNPNTAQEDGLVAVGGDLSPQTLFNAYSNGIFPWPMDSNGPMLWFSLNPRGVLYTKDIHISSSMKRFINKKKYTVTFNKSFKEVIDLCQKVKRKDQSDTWIDQRIRTAYIELYERGEAYSVEVYNQEQKLVAGSYGICFGEMITGESMFHLETNTSKLAIISLVQKLREKNINLLDTQMVTPVIASLGAKEITRDTFLKEITSLDFNIKRESIFS